MNASMIACSETMPGHVRGMNIVRQFDITNGVTPSRGQSNTSRLPVTVQGLVARTIQDDPTTNAQKTACQALISWLLGTESFLVTESWEISHADSGAPLLLVNDRPFDASISMSHSGPWIAVVIARGAEVGIDVEVNEVRPRFSAMASYMGWLDVAENPDQFLLYWTLWESCVKLEQSSIFKTRNRSFEALRPGAGPGRFYQSGCWSGWSETLNGDACMALALKTPCPSVLDLKVM